MGTARLRIGACLSLTGRHARFGRQAAAGLRAWQAWRGDADLDIEDDGSQPEHVEAAIRRLRSRCDVLLGPYSTGLAQAAGTAAAALDTVIWNHGGAGDHVQDGHPGHVVSVLTPARRYAEPFLRRLAGHAQRLPLRIVHGRGRWSRQVAAGARDLAGRGGIEVVAGGAGPLRADATPQAWDLLTCGSFEEDVATVAAARSLPRPPRELCAVAAGVRAFGSHVDRADGILGLAQWSPGRAPAAAPAWIGPAEAEFLAACSRWAATPPDYPAAQAVAAAVLAIHCAAAAGGTERASTWAAATGLEAATFFGGFRIDPVTGAQRLHETVLLRWTGAEAPPAWAAVEAPADLGAVVARPPCVDNTTDL
jgi:Periplasmic binding protein